MPGIVAGIDGSGHSRKALEWAVNEAAVRHAPLTVLTVNQVVTGMPAAASDSTDMLIRHAHCPVVVIPSQTSDRQPGKEETAMSATVKTSWAPTSRASEHAPGPG